MWVIADESPRNVKISSNTFSKLSLLIFSAHRLPSFFSSSAFKSNFSASGKQHTRKGLPSHVYLPLISHGTKDLIFTVVQKPKDAIVGEENRYEHLFSRVSQTEDFINNLI